MSVRAFFFLKFKKVVHESSQHCVTWYR